MFGDLVSWLQNDAQVDKVENLRKRRTALLELIAQKHPTKNGSVFFFAPTEWDHQRFIQESCFYYFSGISQPAHVMQLSLMNALATLYQPDFAGEREKWMYNADLINDQTKILLGIDSLLPMGKQIAGYHVDPYFSGEHYQVVIERLQALVNAQEFIFTLYPVHSRAYASVKIVVDRLAMFVPGLHAQIVDISDLVAQVRRKKDMNEIELMYQASAITAAAFQAASHVIQPGVTEAQVQGAIEYIFTENQSMPAYQTIVGSGKNSTILHYHANHAPLVQNDVVLIDAGAMYQHYCADVTRVFPVSGKFTVRQKELYQIVLDAQQHVVDALQPGMWLSNAQYPDKSLQHLALNYFKKYGYDQYFIHGVGHYLGLDVHDVGSRQDPLAEGDVITVEPGLYISEENIGIRIEDNYWIIADAQPMCITDEIVKSIDEIEQSAQQNFENK